MDLVDKLDVSVNKKRIFNNYRIYYRVNSVAEITNCQGTHVMKQFLSKYNIKTYNSTSTLKWPNQQPPDDKYFNIWISILRDILGIDKTGKLRQPLGKWITQTTHQVPPNIHYMIHKNNQTKQLVCGRAIT
jgi:hypothetical protein